LKWLRVGIENGGQWSCRSFRSTALSKARPLIAVVDDEEQVRRALRRLINSAGLEVETFTGGAEFIQSLARRKPDCVVLDLHMPGVSGFDVQCQLAQLSYHIPVVAITGRDSDESRDRAAAGGAAAYLRKPVDGQTLLATLTLTVWGESE
jgi:FixJ family two-component response regulator